MSIDPLEVPTLGARVSRLRWRMIEEAGLSRRRLIEEASLSRRRLLAEDGIGWLEPSEL